MIFYLPFDEIFTTQFSILQEEILNHEWTDFIPVALILTESV